MTGVAGGKDVTYGIEWGCDTNQPRGHIRMPSPPTPPATATPTRHERLLEVLETVPDPRDRRGIRYSFAAIGQ
ncbi:hypothetical protein GCM10023353_38320 [Tomitella cavernea]|uniref:Transposase n=1 Tax=Tomitella cavernea TaxID=1387982 RepID=A0ABP9D8S8_9ACTN